MEQAYGRGSAAEGGSHPDPGTGLEESMWQLALEGRRGGDLAYPERPGEPDCNYYMRTGSCGYGDRCRYNHPRSRAMIAASARTGGGEYPERTGQPVCQYFLKTGTCKFGASCKYHHPRQGGPVHPTQLNIYGFPLRPVWSPSFAAITPKILSISIQLVSHMLLLVNLVGCQVMQGEKECSYYVKTGHCKFGATCKFHHPQPAVTSMPAPAPPFYPSMQSPSVHSPHQFSAVASWQVARSPPQIPGSYVQAPYGHVILSSGMVPVSGWSPFPPPVNTVMPPGGPPTAEAGSLYGLSHHLSPSAPTYIGPYQPVSPSAGPSSSQREHLFPERPGQPECQYYVKTGDCKFGSSCKYHHPPERSIPKTSYFLNPMGLPLRPGAPPCTFFAQHGVCKFGPSCKFDHPMAILSYSPSASSLADMPVAPFPVGLSAGILAPSSSSTDLRHDLVAGTSHKNSFSTQMPSGGNTSISSIGSIFSKNGIGSHSLAQAPLQSSTPSTSSSSIGHGGEVTSSR